MKINLSTNKIYNLLIVVLGVALAAVMGWLWYLLWGKNNQTMNRGEQPVVNQIQEPDDGLEQTVKLRLGSRIPEEVVPKLQIIDSGELIPLATEEQVLDYAPLNPVSGYGEYQYPFGVTDPDDPLYVKYQPKDITFEYDPENFRIIMKWQDPDTKPMPYMWAVGYWHQPFDPLEKTDLNLPEGEDIYWEIIDRNHPQFYKAEKIIHLRTNIHEDPDKNVNELFISIFAKVKLRDDLYVDYLYGEANSIKPININVN